MYPDPKRVRSNRYTIRLDDYEDGLVQAMANYQGEQLATLLRELAQGCRLLWRRWQQDALRTHRLLPDRHGVSDRPTNQRSARP